MNRHLKSAIKRHVNEDRLKTYLEKHNKSIDGWLADEAVTLAVLTASAQREKNLSGPAVEIGVHHGKFFILLHELLNNQDISMAIDLFSEQSSNLDKSGCGNLAQFKRHLNRVSINPSRVIIKEADSTTLSGKKLVEELGGAHPMLFSVDGGHTLEVAYHDIRTAFESVGLGGAIILDDYFNHGWPEVSEALNRVSCEVDVFPFAVGGNKVFLTNDPDMHQIYIRFLSEALKSTRTKTSRFLGSEIIILEPFHKRIDVLYFKIRNLLKRLIRIEKTT